MYLQAILANGGAFIFGILLGWSAPTAEHIIKNKDYYFWVNNNQFGWIVGLMALGAAISCVLSGYIRSKIGTRFAISLFGIPVIIGFAMISIPLNPAMLMIGRFLTGFSAGCYTYVIPMYVGEISSDSIRGSMLSMFQLTLNVGLLFVFTVGHFASLLTLNIICGVIPIVYSLGFLFLPESPAILIRNNREAKAKRALKKLRGSSFNPDSEIDTLKQQNEEEKFQKKTFSEVFRTKSTMKAFTIIMLQFFFFQMSGINAVFFYSTTIFTSAGIGIEPGIASIIIASVQVASNFLAVAFSDKFGRKFLLCLSNVLMCLGLIGIGVFFTLLDNGSNVENLDWLPILSLSIFVIAFSSGMGPVSYILYGELFQQDAKPFVAPIAQTFNFLLTFAIGLTFPMLSSAIGLAPSFFMFAGFCALALIFTIFIIPETKGKSRAEIQALLG